MKQEDSKAEKTCTVCKQVKPITEFYKDAQRRDGHYSKCKSCHSRFVKNWQINNKAKFKELNETWKKTHNVRIRETERIRAGKNREKRQTAFNVWRAKNPEYGKNWRKNNKEKVRLYAQNRRARILGNGGELTKEEWDAVLDFYGHKCLCCGRDDMKLTIDHVVPIFQGGKHSADNVQPLCGPCNSRKKDKYIDYRKEKYHAPSGN